MKSTTLGYSLEKGELKIFKENKSTTVKKNIYLILLLTLVCRKKKIIYIVQIDLSIMHFKSYFNYIFVSIYIHHSNCPKGKKYVCAR